MIVKKIIREDIGAFYCGGSEYDSANENRHNNDYSNNNSETSRTNMPMYVNDNIEDKCKTSPNRIIDFLFNINRRQALQILFCDEKDDM